MTAIDRNIWFADLKERHRETLVGWLAEGEAPEFEQNWGFFARDAQLAPQMDWRIWLIMAGRGFGKTRAGAEWVRAVAEADPRARIALVAASLGEARSIMVEGESGIIACCPSNRVPRFEPSLRRLTWESGAQAMLYSAAEPESLRGPQHSHSSGPDAEGGVRQRSPCPVRRPAPSCDRGRDGDSTDDAGGWRELAGRFLAHGCLGGAGRQACLPPGG